MSISWEDDLLVEEVVTEYLNVRRRLLELPLEAVEVQQQSGPDDAKAGAGLELSEFVLTGLGTSGVLAAIVATLQSRFSAPKIRRVKLDIDGDVIEVDNISEERQNQLINDWLQRNEP